MSVGGNVSSNFLFIFQILSKEKLSMHKMRRPWFECIIYSTVDGFSKRLALVIEQGQAQTTKYKMLLL